MQQPPREEDYIPLPRIKRDPPKPPVKITPSFDE